MTLASSTLPRPAALHALALALWISFLCLRAQPQAPQAASITGRVINAATGAPLPGAKVILIGGGQSNPAKSDAQGRFRFESLRKSRYGIMLDAQQGYLARELLVDMRDAQHDVAVDLKASKAGVISGKVQDRLRRPVAGVTVSLINADMTDGPFRPRHAGTAETTETGEYRIANLRPGRFRVLAERKTIKVLVKPAAANARAGAGPAVESDVSTYYPHAALIHEAGVVSLALGQSAEGIDITLASEKTFCASSKIVDPGDTGAGEMDVRLLRNYRESLPPVARARIPAGAAFEACGLAPGSFRLTVWPVGGGGEERLALHNFEISSRSVRLPDLVLAPLVQVAGQLRLDPAGTEQPFEEPVRISADPDASLGCSINEVKQRRLDQPGPFALTLCPDPYWLTVRAPAGFYVKSALAGGVDILRNKFQPGDAELVVVLGRPGPTLVVQVTDGKDQPVPGAVIVLGPDPAPASFGPSDVVIAATDVSGQATLNGIAPGSYNVLAHVAPWDFGAMTSPAFLVRHQAECERVKLTAGENRNLKLKVKDLE